PPVRAALLLSGPLRAARTPGPHRGGDDRRCDSLGERRPGRPALGQPGTGRLLTFGQVAARIRSAASPVWRRTIIGVTGPMPPGTGVIARTTGVTVASSTSPAMPPGTALIPQSTTTA